MPLKLIVSLVKHFIIWVLHAIPQKQKLRIQNEFSHSQDVCDDTNAPVKEGEGGKTKKLRYSCFIQIQNTTQLGSLTTCLLAAPEAHS